MSETESPKQYLINHLRTMLIWRWEAAKEINAALENLNAKLFRAYQVHQKIDIHFDRPVPYNYKPLSESAAAQPIGRVVTGIFGLPIGTDKTLIDSVLSSNDQILEEYKSKGGV